MPRRAFRRSCDRCHAQKIKCIGSEGAVARASCQRCQQAGLRCVYSERCPKRKLPKPNPAESSPASSTAGLHTSSSDSSPPVPSDGLPLDLPGPDSSGVSLQFLDPSADCDWPWSSIGVDETVVNNCLDLSHGHGHGDLSCQLELPMPDLPSPFEFSAEKSPSPSVSGSIAGAVSAQRELFDGLSTVSQELEAILLAVAVEWPKQEIWTYPIGTFFNASRRLLVYLQQQSNTRSDQGMLDECLRTKNLFMAVHCYMLIVKIFTSLSELLLSQIRHSQAGQLTPLEGHQFEPPPSSSRDRSSVDTMPIFNPNLHIGGLFSYLNPFMHALSSACTTLRVGVQLLRENESALGIPPAQGVAASVSMGKEEWADGEDVASAVTTADEDLRQPASRILSMVWSDEVGDQKAKSADAAGPRSRTLAVLRRCNREIFSLARQHNLAS